MVAKTKIGAVFAASLITGFCGQAIADDCPTAARAYYCMGATLALGQSAEKDNEALGKALRLQAAAYGTQAKSLGFASLADEFVLAGVKDAAKAGKPGGMEQLIAICVQPDERDVTNFDSRVPKQACPVADSGG